MNKWTANYEKYLYIVEQLLKTMPTDLRVWVAERKPTTAAEDGQLAEDYLEARWQITRNSDTKEGQTETRRCHRFHMEGH